MDGAGIAVPFAVPADADEDGGKLSGIDLLDDGGSRSEGDFIFRRTAAKEDGDIGFFHIMHALL